MVAVLREGLEYVLSPSSPQGKDDRSSSHDLGEPFFKTPNSFIDIDGDGAAVVAVFDGLQSLAAARTSPPLSH